MNIKIIPSRLTGSIEGIASKSVAHRALICACLAHGSSKIKINTTSQDIEATVSCLRGMGAYIEQNGNIYSVEPIKQTPSIAKIDCGESGSGRYDENRKKLQLLAVEGHHRFDDRLFHVLFRKEELLFCHSGTRS